MPKIFTNKEQIFSKAAHCLEEQSKTGVIVEVTHDLRSEEARKFKTSSEYFWMHPVYEYNAKLKNNNVSCDIAVIRLRDPVVESGMHIKLKNAKNNIFVTFFIFKPLLKSSTYLTVISMSQVKLEILLVME